MPEEILALAIVTVVFSSVTIITITKAVLRYRERVRFGVPGPDRLKASSSEGTSLTTSELEGMMRRAVADATAPLNDRLEALENRMTALPGASIGDLPDDAHGSRSTEPVRKTLGGRTS